jgi:hypothetical protein
MRRTLAVTLLVLAACERASEPTSVQRGERVFRPISDRLGADLVSSLKKSNPNGFEQYLKEIGGKDEGDLARKIGLETFAHYSDALSMSAAKEAELKAGKFEDAMNRRKVQAAMERLSDPKAKVPPVCKALIDKQKAGEWPSGLELEFTARVLDSQVRAPHE